LAALLVSLVMGAACATARPAVQPQQDVAFGVVEPLPTAVVRTQEWSEQWRLTLESIASLAARGQFAKADSVLALFASNHDGSCAAAEAMYTRALLKLAPNNTSRSSRDAVGLLDAYVGSTCLPPNRAAEVNLIRNFAVELAHRPVLSDSASAEEVRKLREQLDQTKRDLERLKLRVIPPGGDGRRGQPTRKSSKARE
jgi:hypothetical protein